MGWTGEVQNADKTRAWSGAAAPHTTEGDFCRLFKEDMAGLYTLSLLLTADNTLAERCFVGGLDDCVNGNPVFRDWAHAWSRRAIIMNAIRIVFATRVNPLLSTGAVIDERGWFATGPLAWVVRLQPLERFVFVMSLLEGYSDHECSVLLNRSRGQVVAARAEALRHMAEWNASSEMQNTTRKAPAMFADL